MCVSRDFLGIETPTSTCWKANKHLPGPVSQNINIDLNQEIHQPGTVSVYVSQAQKTRAENNVGMNVVPETAKSDTNSLSLSLFEFF